MVLILLQACLKVMADNEPLLLSCNWQLECVSSLEPPHKVLASPAVLQLRQLRARQAEAARHGTKQPSRPAAGWSELTHCISSRQHVSRSDNDKHTCFSCFAIHVVGLFNSECYTPAENHNKSK